MATTVSGTIAVIHRYQELSPDNEWLPPVLKINNPRRLPAGDISRVVESYKQEFGPRLNQPKEYLFGRVFEGKRGYRWEDIGFRLTTITTDTIEFDEIEEK